MQNSSNSIITNLMDKIQPVKLNKIHLPCSFPFRLLSKPPFNIPDMNSWSSSSVFHKWCPLLPNHNKLWQIFITWAPLHSLSPLTESQSLLPFSGCRAIRLRDLPPSNMLLWQAIHSHRRLDYTVLERINSLLLVTIFQVVTKINKVKSDPTSISRELYYWYL